jgi:hypothetical protein
MDLDKAIQELLEQKKQIELAIRTLEGLIRGESKPAARRRGRKSMSEHERKIVSERMTQYWASRRR